ncbi:hypothetical protein [Marinobacter sp. SS21]|uniref:hypothetical protein n=1 Tax=Marinobacter sp. SS21 TaxID=2979460 RepID=UPI00232F7E79|nr:hypothetical protein [Marinobacter sp. SS21]MDC0664223.1 hypothetical protein [Marinobacter sp. SS21]
MSLLNSLARMSAGLQQASSQRTPPQATPNAAAGASEDTASGRDDVTLSGGPLPKASAKLAINQYKSSLGQDTHFVKETLRHKIAEYGIHPGTRMSVTKSDQGTLRLQAAIPAEKRERIEQDLNNNKSFTDAFHRLSSQQPTLAFVDGALKLNQAYGVNNALLESLVSENDQFNGLGDLVHRYDNIRRMVGAEDIAAAGNQRDYAFSLNTRA